MPEIIRITSEALQAQIRRLLPSQQGFGEDLQASNLITPIIDLTPIAEGSSVPSYLQTALAFGSNTSFKVVDTTTTLTSTAGFYRVVGTSNIQQPVSGESRTEIQLSDGLSTKSLWQHLQSAGNQDGQVSNSFDLVFFLRPGDSLSILSNDAEALVTGSFRQVADVTGNLVNPVGFTIE